MTGIAAPAVPASGSYWRWQKARTAALRRVELADPAGDIEQLRCSLPPWHGLPRFEHGGQYFLLDAAPRPEIDDSEGGLVAFIVGGRPSREEDVLVLLSVDHARALRDGLTQVINNVEARTPR